MRGTTWLDLAFMVQGPLFAQKEGLGGEGRTGAQAQDQEAPCTHEEHPQHACEWHEVAEQARVSSHGEGIPLKHNLRSLPIIAAGGRDVQSLRMEYSGAQAQPAATLQRLRCRSANISLFPCRVAAHSIRAYYSFVLFS
jgi:hypothetical protein